MTVSTIGAGASSSIAPVIAASALGTAPSLMGAGGSAAPAAQPAATPQPYNLNAINPADYTASDYVNPYLSPTGEYPPKSSSYWNLPKTFGPSPEP